MCTAITVDVGTALHGLLADRARARAYTRQVGDDSPDVRDWVWSGSRPPAEIATDALRG